VLKDGKAGPCFPALLFLLTSTHPFRLPSSSPSLSPSPTLTNALGFGAIASCFPADGSPSSLATSDEATAAVLPSAAALPPVTAVTQPPVTAGMLPPMPAPLLTAGAVPPPPSAPCTCPGGASTWPAATGFSCSLAHTVTSTSPPGATHRSSSRMACRRRCRVLRWVEHGDGDGRVEGTGAEGYA